MISSPPYKGGARGGLPLLKKEGLGVVSIRLRVVLNNFLKKIFLPKTLKHYNKIKKPY